MPTRLKRPSRWRSMLLATGLVAFQGYLAASVFTGQFGVESSKQVQQDIELLTARSISLQAEIDAYRHRVALFDRKALDPDLLTEQARALLSMSRPDEVIVMTDPASGKLLSGSAEQLAQDQLSDLIEGGID
jgi:cell division protein FtsB